VKRRSSSYSDVVLSPIFVNYYRGEIVMKKIYQWMLLILACSILILLNTTHVQSSTRTERFLYVSPSGSDVSGDGTIGKPYLTIEKARDVVREISKRSYSGITVYLRGGEYFTQAAIEFTAEDSGTRDCPVTYRGYRSETAIITGAKTIPSSAFQPVTDITILSRIADAGTRENLVEVTLTDYGIEDGEIVPTGFGVGDGNEIAPAELFFDNVPMTLSRWPNKSFTSISALTTETTNQQDNTEVMGNTDNTENTDLNKFNYGLETRPEGWKFNHDIWVRGYFVSSGWGDCTFRVLDINRETKVITTNAAPVYGYNMTGKYYYYLNVLEEIDMPGEYYIDRSSHKLYFYPPYKIGLGSVKVSSSQMELLHGSELQYVTFKNIIFEGTRNSGIDITDSSDHISIESCVIRNIGRTGVLLNGVTNTTIKNSEIKYTGKGGLYLYGGDRMSLSAANIIASNNHITDYNRIWKTYCSGITIASGVGCKVKHNLIHDSTHTGILFGGNDNLLDQNEIYDVTQETDDAGAIYSGRDYTYRGNIISNNFIHDGRSIVTFCGTTGIYLDDYMSSATVYNNIISNFYHGMVLGGGRDHNIYNNLIMECDLSIDFDDRNKRLTPSGLKSLESYTQYYRLSKWKAKYPSLYAMIKDNNPGYPKGSTIRNNVLYQSGAINLSPLVTTYGKVINNRKFTSKLSLKDKESDQYDSNALAPVYKKLPSFHLIEFENIGLDYEKVTHLDNTFHLKMPENGAILTADAEEGIYFAWQQLAYADQYNVVISEDFDFNNIIVEKTVEDNYCTINSLKRGHTYYWKVLSIQDASSVPREIECNTAEFYFEIGK